MAILLLVLLMSYKVCVTMFVHTHDVDGTMVAHSHPFTNSNHSHSASQIIVFGQLSSFNGVEHKAYEEINVYHNSVREIEYSNQNLYVISEGKVCLSLRAPPASC
ncbi:MAG: hypothetical protein IKV32_06390 [Muribaculaceae bacterium]|nr:hypothetical protein [Muribaculaceae bacterium]